MPCPERRQNLKYLNKAINSFTLSCTNGCQCADWHEAQAPIPNFVKIRQTVQSLVLSQRQKDVAYPYAAVCYFVRKAFPATFQMRFSHQPSAASADLEVSQSADPCTFHLIRNGVTSQSQLICAALFHYNYITRVNGRNLSPN